MKDLLLGELLFAVGRYSRPNAGRLRIVVSHR